MMVLFTCLHFPMNQQGGCVPLMWHAALCSGLATLSNGWAELSRNLSTLITPQVERKKNKTIRDNKATRVLIPIPTILAFHHKPDGTYSSLTVFLLNHC